MIDRVYTGMGVVLFDWKSPTACKKVKNALLARVCLFDGYLTESSSYPHFGIDAYLTMKPTTFIKKVLNPLFLRFCLFDCHLTKTLVLTQISHFHND